MLKKLPEKLCISKIKSYLCNAFEKQSNNASLAQLVRASDC